MKQSFSEGESPTLMTAPFGATIKNDIANL